MLNVKKFSFLLIALALIVLLTTSVYAIDLDDFTNGSLSNTNTPNQIQNVPITNNDTNVNTNVPNTNTNVPSTNNVNTITPITNNSNTSNTSNLPQSGIEDNPILFCMIIVFIVIAIYARKKINDYKM